MLPREHGTVSKLDFVAAAEPRGLCHAAFNMKSHLSPPDLLAMPTLF